MGFGNFLVKALNKSAEFIETVSEKAAEAKSAEANPAEKKAAEENLEEEEKFGCEKGECFYNCEIFYHTCNDLECPKMKAAKKVSHDGIIDPVLIPYMKRLAVLNELYKIDEDGSVFVPDMADFIHDLITNHMPAYGAYAVDLGMDFNFRGIAKESPFFQLLWDMKDKNICLSEHKMQMLMFGEVFDHSFDLSHSFYRNPSLYDRTDDEFDYTVKIFEIMLTPELRAKYYIETDKIGVDQFFDAEGNIKPAGLHDDEGEQGDSIWYTVERWKEYAVED